MKKLLSIILLLAVSFTFAACSDDDDDDKKGGGGDKFVWNGDWNDPDDPNFKPEGYNPIQGMWRSVNVPNTGLYYSDDRIEYRVIFYSVGSPSKSKYGSYKINDKAYKTKETWMYKFEGENIMYIKNPTWSDDEWIKYNRVIE